MASTDAPHPEREHSEPSPFGTPPRGDGSTGDTGTSTRSETATAPEPAPVFAGSPVMLQYHEIKRAHPGCLLFFRMVDFYVLFLDDVVATAGTLTEDGLLDARRHNYLAGIAEAGGEIGLAWLDLSTGAFALTPTSETALGGELARLMPGEIVLPERLLARPALFELFAE